MRKLRSRAFGRAATLLVSFGTLGGGGLLGTGCAQPEVAHVVTPNETAAASSEDGITTTTAATTAPTSSGSSAASGDDSEAAGPHAAWLGANPVSDAILASGGSVDLGVWVDAPQAAHGKGWHRAPLDLALVLDVSGSMSGAKIERARDAAKAIVRELEPGDVVSVTTFSQEARIVQNNISITPASRDAVLGVIDRVRTEGQTNLFAGLQMGELQAANTTDPRFVRRVILLSDGKANVGMTDPGVLARLAEQGLESHTQITALGIGLDYDERTLDTLAVASGGRLYHLTNPEETAPILEKELALLQSTVATDAFLEIVPAPGVTLEQTFLPGRPDNEVMTGSPMNGVQANAPRRSVSYAAHAGSLSVPLGALFAGQHREALVRLHISQNDRGWRDAPRALASVNLRYRDPAEGGLERVQEVVARVRTTDSADEVARTSNSRAQVIAATVAAANAEVQAAQAVGSGKFDDADQALASAGAALTRSAAVAASPVAKRRLEKAASDVEEQRKVAHAARSAPASVQRESSLKMNSAGMSSLGY